MIKKTVKLITIFSIFFEIFCLWFWFLIIFNYYFILFHFISFYFILFYFIIFNFILFYFILFYFILFYFTYLFIYLFYFILFYFIIFHYILFYYIFIWIWLSSLLLHIIIYIMLHLTSSQLFYSYHLIKYNFKAKEKFKEIKKNHLISSHLFYFILFHVFKLI